MADEITISTSLAVNNGTLTVGQSDNTTADQTTKGAVQRTQTIPTSNTVITLTGVTSPRAILIKNRDTANYIDIGPTSGSSLVACVRLRAGESCLMPLTPSVVLRGQANTASVAIDYLIVET